MGPAINRIHALLVVLLLTCGIFSACEGGNEKGPVEVEPPGSTISTETTESAITTDSALTEDGGSTVSAVTAVTPAALTEVSPPAAKKKEGTKPAAATPARKDSAERSKDTAKSPAAGERKKPAGEASKPATPGKPVTEPAAQPQTISCTIGIDCTTLQAADPDVAGQVSDSGVILENKTVEVKQGACVLDVLKACGVPFAGTAYISSINGLSEGDGGQKSGWVYHVNGTYPVAGVKKFIVKDGDHIQFRYTCNGGGDVKS
jgi:hypothetical protein